MQTSQVFNQVKWPLAGDIDDCWVVSAIQAVNVVAPWLRLPSVKEFRANAGDPDDGNHDGGNLHEIVEGITNTWPALAGGKLNVIRAGTWDELVADLKDHRPVSLAVKSMFLPERLRYGFNGYHQVTMAMKADGSVMFANPLAPVYSRWDELIAPDEVKEAVLRYGADKVGHRSVFAVTVPPEAAMLLLHPLWKPVGGGAYAEGYATARTKAVDAVSSI